MSDYGAFANVVGVAGSLAAAVGAITLAFKKRTRWQPPEECVPAAVARVSSLIAMVFVALIYVFAKAIGPFILAVLAIVCLIIAMYALIQALTTNVRYSFFYPNSEETNRKLGGSELTPEAANIQKATGQTVQQLFSDAQGKKDLVWTRQSQAEIQVWSTLSFIGLIAFGTCALSSASMLVAVYGGP
jgi:energy-coupling factor transporter transmembrane protein EcfT